jgi:hypothetical protein
MSAAVVAVRAERWRRVRPRHVVDVVQVAVLAMLLGGIEVGLRTTRVDRLASLLRVRFRSGGELRASSDDTPFVDGEGRWLRNAARLLRRWPLDATCLRRSLLLGWILRAREPLLVLGVRNEDGVIQAHAWIRLGERDLDPGAATYVAFDLSPPPAR